MDKKVDISAEVTAANEPVEIFNTNDAPEIAVPEKFLDPIKIISKKRRKDKLQPIATPDIQFETITLDDVNESSRKKKRQRKVKKTDNNGKGTQPRKNKPVSLIIKACDEFLEDPETEKLLRDIAEERVRINYLLASFGMPDINFVLGNTINTLDNQLSERFRLRNRKRGILT